MTNDPETQLRRGWTTGSCATAATRAAYEALVTGRFPDPVEITLPSGKRVGFTLAEQHLGPDWAEAAVIKDAGDDPDVTHGATVRARVRLLGEGIHFKAGKGVGTVTRPGLPLAVGEPAINPVPRQMMQTTIAEATAATGGPSGVEITIGIDNGVEIAKKTLNGRLGIIGGLSVLGTRGVVIPFSCSSWIHSIYRGIDVARATGITHVAASTGNTSERAIAKLDNLPEPALLEMGDFAGATLKYLRRNPVARVTIAGGFAKMVKLACGTMDLHSRAGPVDMRSLAAFAQEAGADNALLKRIPSANTALEVLQMSGDLPLAQTVAKHAKAQALHMLSPEDIALDVAIFDRQGQLLARV